MWRKLLLVGIGVVAVVVASKVTAPSPEDEKQIHVSDEFKTEARKTFDAIKRCDDYVTNAGIYYEPRLLEAQKSLDSLRSRANGIAEMNQETILFNYLLAVQRQRLDLDHFSQIPKAQHDRDEAAKVKAYLEAM